VRIKTLISDVDGILNDGIYYYGRSGLIMKGFNCNDSVAIKVARAAGIYMVFVTSASELSYRITMLRLTDWGPPVTLLECDFGKKLERIEDEEINLSEAAFVGDCVDDIPLLRAAAISFAPASAIDTVKRAASQVLKRRGGEGCLLEVVERLGLL
jgi:3-deoxy-D-manno-octulosonate 8-phosphate phosphatase (KDO 8-P phosphatase)